MTAANEPSPVIPSDSDAPMSIGLWVEPQQIPDDISFIHHLALGLKSEGHSVCLFASAQHTDEELGIFAVPVVRVDHSPRHWHDFLFRAPGPNPFGSVANRQDSIQTVLTKCRSKEVQVVVLFGPTATALPGFSELSRNIPVLYWCWDSADGHGRLAGTAEFSGLLAASEPLQNGLKAMPGAAAQILRPGVFVSTPEPRESSGQSPCFVCLDSLAGLTDFSNLLRACRDVADARHDFLIFLYDSGPDKHAIWKLTQSLELLDRVSFVPYRNDCESLLLHGDFYLQATESSRLNYLVLQAMARGMPVLSRPSAAADFCTDGQTCRIIAHGSREEWRDALIGALTQKESSRRMSQAALQRLRQHHSMSDMLSLLVAHCRRAVAAPIPFPKPGPVAP